MSNTKVYLAPMEGLTDYMFRNAFDEFFGHGKIDKYFMPFISPNQTEKFLAKEMRDIDRNNNLINSIPQIMTNNSEDFSRITEVLTKIINSCVYYPHDNTLPF